MYEQMCEMRDEGWEISIRSPSLSPWRQFSLQTLNPFVNKYRYLFFPISLGHLYLAGEGGCARYLYALCPMP